MIGFLCLFRPHRWTHVGDVLVRELYRQRDPVERGLWQCTRCCELRVGITRTAYVDTGRSVVGTPPEHQTPAEVGAKEPVIPQPQHCQPQQDDSAKALADYQRAVVFGTDAPDEPYYTELARQIMDERRELNQKGLT